MTDSVEVITESKDAPTPTEGVRANSLTSSVAKEREGKPDTSSKYDDGGKRNNPDRSKSVPDRESDEKSQRKDSEEGKGGRVGSWNKGEQTRKPPGTQHNDRHPGRFSKQNRQEAAGKNEIRGKAELESIKDSDGGSQTSQQPKGKRYERDRRESWKGRNERRQQLQQQQQMTEKGKDSSQQAVGSTDRQNEESEHFGHLSQEDLRARTSAANNSYKRADSSRMDSKDKQPYKHKSDGFQSSPRDGSGRSSDQSFRGDSKDSRDRDTRSNRQHGKDSRQGSARGGQGNGSRKSSHGDGEKHQSDGKLRSDYKRKDSGGSWKDLERGRKNNDRDSDPGQLNITSGAELLSLLNQNLPPKGNKSKGRDGKGKVARLPSAAELEAKWHEEEQEKRRKEEEERKREEERLRKEEEERKATEERIRLEEEKRQREEEEARRVEAEERKLVIDYIAEVNEKSVNKPEIRHKNMNAADTRPDESFFTKLDSSLKKNTAFVKRLRNLTEAQKESIAKDFNSLNLSKYVGEAAAALTEAKLKMSDIPCALHISSLLHQRYTDFSAMLMENWMKTLPNKRDEKAFNASKLRVDLRLFAELVSCGVFTDKEGLPVLANLLTLLMSADKEDHNNLSIILSFCKHCGDDYAGLCPRKYRLLAEKYEYELTRNSFLPKERQKACRQLLKDYYTSLTRHLLREHRELKNIEKHNRKVLQTKGELSADRKERYEAAQQIYHKLYTNTAAFADILDEDMPELPIDDAKSDPDGIGLDLFNPLKNAEYQYEGDTSLFEDDDTRTFYETLPDLKAFIPGILYKDSENAEPLHIPLDMESNLEDDIASLEIEDLDVELEEPQGDPEREDEESADMETDPALKGGEKEPEKEEHFEAVDLLPEIEVTSPKEVRVIESLIRMSSEKKAPSIKKMIKLYDDCDIASSMKLIMEAFLTSLPNCVNRELIDKAAIDFCMNLNTKANRRKLVRGLFTVQRTRYDLLPFYARLVGTLHPCMPDVANDLVVFLKGDFRWHVRKKDQINIESKLKTVRFIGELVKFKMFPQTESLHCLKMLLHDFSHHNIDMACSLLETCGRFLYRSPDSHHRTKVYLDVLMRKKAALHLDSRYATMIENAYYYSNPPDVKSEQRKVRPPMHEYVRRLLYKDLSKITTEKVLRQMRKLQWDDADIAAYITKCLTAIWNVRYNSIHCIANLLAGVAPYHEHVAIQVVDGVLEEIRLGMEINIPKYNQRRVCAVKFLGELYNYRMVESAVIFKTLYSFISFGVSMDEEVPLDLDPPEHLFRVRLVCVLLDTCGQYFDRGSSKKKLDCFLVYFQKYYWFKRSLAIWTEDHPFPMDIEYLMKDVLEALRPKLHLHESYAAACEASGLLDQEFRARLADVLPAQQDAEDTEEDDSRLPAIKENDEMDDLSQGLSQLVMTGEDHSTQDSELGGDERSGSQSQPANQSNDCRPMHRGRRDEGEEGTVRVEDEEEDDDDSDDELMESAGEDEDDDQVTVLTGGPKLVKCSEDEDFMTAFDKMMLDNLQARTHESAKVPQVDIAVPMHLRGQKQKTGAIPVIQGVALAPPSPPPEEEPNHINFVLMTKRGNKQQFTKLNVPISAEFATKFREREEAERVEKERMKRVVLDIHERQEEEDYQDMIASLSRPAMANTNRERRVRYQHPKGAPDADLIFGSK